MPLDTNAYAVRIRWVVLALSFPLWSINFKTSIRRKISPKVSFTNNIYSKKFKKNFDSEEYFLKVI